MRILMRLLKFRGKRGKPDIRVREEGVTGRNENDFEQTIENVRWRNCR